MYAYPFVFSAINCLLLILMFPSPLSSFFSDLSDSLGSLGYLFLVRYVFLDKLPATDDGRSLATLLDIVMIKYQINMKR